MVETLEIPHASDVPVGQPELPAFEPAKEALPEAPTTESPEPAGSPLEEKPPHEAEAREAREQRVRTRFERIVDHTKTYLSDMGLAYQVAGARLGGQSVTGKILEGAAVTGIGTGLELVVESAFSSVLGEILGRVRGLGGEAAGVEKVSIQKDPKQVWKATDIVGTRIFLHPEQERVRLTHEYTRSIDEHGNVVSSDIRANLHKILSEQLKAKNSRFRTHLVTALMEGFDDTAVLAMYGLMNRITGSMLPRIPTEYYGASLALDFLGIGQSPGETKTDASAGKPEAAAVGQPPGIRDRLAKSVETGQKVLNFSNPVTLFGLSLMKSGAATYLETLKAIRAKRKEVESGMARQIYVGEGVPQGYGQHRSREGRRDGRRHEYQGRRGRHG